MSHYIYFGKYKNECITEIYKKDRQYLEWLIKQPWVQENTATALNELFKSPIELSHIEHSHSPIKFVIYTDGGCRNNGSKDKEVIAGIGVHFSGENAITLTDISQKLTIKDPTNNKAELLAIDAALELCVDRVSEDIIIYTDSQYCIDVITRLYERWVSSGKLQGKKNIDYIVQIREKMKVLNVSFVHIRSHTGSKDIHSEGNSRADYLATSCCN
jgi:ribonuclease HI